LIEITGFLKIFTEGATYSLLSQKIEDSPFIDFENDIEYS
jgi:hypothetical protein